MSTVPVVLQETSALNITTDQHGWRTLTVDASYPGIRNAGYRYELDSNINFNGGIEIKVALFVAGSIAATGTICCDASLRVTRELESLSIDGIEVQGDLRACEVRTFGDLDVKGDIRTDSVLCAERIKCGGEIRVDEHGIMCSELSAKGDITAEEIHSLGDVTTGRSLTAGAVVVNGSIEVGWHIRAQSIRAGGAISAASITTDAGASAGRWIKSRQIWAGTRLLAGIAVESDARPGDGMIECVELQHGTIGAGTLKLLPKDTAW